MSEFLSPVSVCSFSRPLSPAVGGAPWALFLGGHTGSPTNSPWARVQPPVGWSCSRKHHLLAHLPFRCCKRSLLTPRGSAIQGGPSSPACELGWAPLAGRGCCLLCQALPGPQAPRHRGVPVMAEASHSHSMDSGLPWSIQDRTEHFEGSEHHHWRCLGLPACERMAGEKGPVCFQSGEQRPRACVSSGDVGRWRAVHACPSLPGPWKSNEWSCLQAVKPVVSTMFSFTKKVRGGE